MNTTEHVGPSRSSSPPMWKLSGSTMWPSELAVNGPNEGLGLSGPITLHLGVGLQPSLAFHTSEQSEWTLTGARSNRPVATVVYSPRSIPTLRVETYRPGAVISWSRLRLRVHFGNSFWEGRTATDNKRT